MANCKECIHYDICYKIYEYFIKPIHSIDTNLVVMGGCSDFKDKSRYIELPCKVGDTIYEIMDIESVHRQILEMKVLSIEIKDTTKFFAKTVKKYLYNYGTFTLYDIGKTVFFTYEEAEKALKELKDD